MKNFLWDSIANERITNETIDNYVSDNHQITIGNV